MNEKNSLKQLTMVVLARLSRLARVESMSICDEPEEAAISASA